MIKNLKHIIITSLVVCYSTFLFSQVDTDEHDVSFTIPEIALLDIEPDNTTITLQLSPPLEGGEPVIITSAGIDKSKWLNYTSAISPFSNNRYITAQITSGNIPAGLELSLETSNFSGNGDGALGVPSGIIVLSTIAQEIITNIGGCYTGNGSFSGHSLKYSLSITNHGLLDFDDSTLIEVTFTISD